MGDNLAIHLFCENDNRDIAFHLTLLGGLWVLEVSQLFEVSHIYTTKSNFSKTLLQSHEIRTRSAEGLPIYGTFAERKISPWGARIASFLGKLAEATGAGLGPRPAKPAPPSGSTIFRRKKLMLFFPEMRESERRLMHPFSPV